MRLINNEISISMTLTHPWDLITAPNGERYYLNNPRGIEIYIECMSIGLEKTNSKYIVPIIKKLENNELEYFLSSFEYQITKLPNDKYIHELYTDILLEMLERKDRESYEKEIKDYIN